ncbi:hypothetical protein H4J02_04735 [Protaetiibacter sp. SSC-01]|uniref:DUF6069 family protein n=1 Tax=Protaetiibacter sp. SSC-01 TaxID=2759943 RepID=UPI001656B114|nr:DUF6069 family protein [Protaetiibacter sp. SSC-01]QNO38331.1 hypothetical protein H4J02_04735 [Protaetiibacter sp. SSC-01]
MTATADRTAPRALTVTLTVLAAVAASALVTSLIALVTRAAGVGEAFPPLQPQAYLAFATAGTLLALGGWLLVVRFVARSARLLRVLVPVLVVLSLVPDVVLLITGFIPGTTPGAVVALALMHPVVAAAAVVAGQRIAPAR